MKNNRSAGVLLPINALPGKFGIGNIGTSAKRFCDFLAQAGQSYWQICPIGHINELNSPYICYSAFAGNPYFIDLMSLEKERYLLPGTLKKVFLGKKNLTGSRIDYQQVRSLYWPIFQNAFIQFQKNHQRNHKDRYYQNFCQQQSHWLEDYALFMACNDFFRTTFDLWPRSIKYRTAQGLRHYRGLLKKEIEFYRFLQFLFFHQWAQLKEYAKEKKIKIIGDIPIFHAFHSVEVWSNPDEYWLDSSLRPTHVAGVPPDYFSSTGQLWGNPLYRWERMQKNRPRYRWWRKVFQHLVECYDITRIDHFRGFLAYWKIPAGAQNAVQGRWEKAPGEDFFHYLAQDHPQMPFLVEDLGLITPDVTHLRDQLDLPGMHILQFAFGQCPETIAPYQFSVKSVTYTGTHDNDTTWGWFQSLTTAERQGVLSYLQLPFHTTARKRAILNRFLGLAHGGVSRLVVIPLQDYLGVGSEGRINTPGQFRDIYTYKIRDKDLTARLATQICQLTKLYGRGRDGEE